MRLSLELFRADGAGDPFAFRTGEQEYVLRTAGGGAATTMLDWNGELLRLLEAVRLPGRDPALVQRLGGLLREFLTRAGWVQHEAAIARALAASEPVELGLRFAAAELYALPWELVTLKGSGQHLGGLPRVLLHYEWPETETTPPAAELQSEDGRILFAFSAAAGAVPAGEQLAAIERACAAGHRRFDAERDVLAHVSLGRLVRALDSARQSGPPIAILHLLCHGGAVGGSFGVVLDDEETPGRSVVVDAGRLRQVLGPYADMVRLVVLSACDGGNMGASGAQLGSMAQTLHRAGYQAVLASRYPLSAAGSVTLTRSLYDCLLGGPSSLEDAVLAAKKRLAEDAARLDWAGLQLYRRGADGDDTRPLVFRPYRGLLAFLSEHRRFFFGRDAEVNEVLTDLAALVQSGAPRFLVVAGASGTGKSSVVLGGALPRLCEAPISAAVEESAQAVQNAVDVLRLHLGQGPSLRALDVIAREATAASDARRLGWRGAVLRPGAEPLAALTTALASRRSTDSRFLLIVDQFEELFTHTADPAVRQQFAARLFSLCRGDSQLACILTLRVDFLGQCGELVLDETELRLDRVAYDEARRVFVAQMVPAQLTAAIEEPARRVGLHLEEGLSARMLAEVGNEPGALPLLEYTLDLLWQRRQGRTLSAGSYEDLGGVIGALSRKADAVLDAMSEEQRSQARQLVVQLVGIGESGAVDTRRRVRLPTLRARAEAQGRAAIFDAVLGLFAAARLSRSGRATGHC